MALTVLNKRKTLSPRAFPPPFPGPSPTQTYTGGQGVGGLQRGGDLGRLKFTPEGEVS